MYYYPLCIYLLKCVYTCIPPNIFLLGIWCKLGSPEAHSEKDIRVQKVLREYSQNQHLQREGMETSWRSQAAVQSKQGFNLLPEELFNGDIPLELSLIVGKGLHFHFNQVIGHKLLWEGGMNQQHRSLQTRATPRNGLQPSIVFQQHSPQLEV